MTLSVHHHCCYKVITCNNKWPSWRCNAYLPHRQDVSASPIQYDSCKKEGSHETEKVSEPTTHVLYTQQGLSEVMELHKCLCTEKSPEEIAELDKAPLVDIS